MGDLEEIITDIVNSVDCLNCRGCCWFSIGEEHLLPFFGQQEINSLDTEEQKKLHKTSEGLFQAESITSKVKKGVRICAFLEEVSHKCSIYEKRPLDCLLWPFDVIRLKNRKQSSIYLSVVSNQMCPATKKGNLLLQDTGQRIIRRLEKLGFFEEIRNGKRHIWNQENFHRLLHSLDDYLQNKID
ncbi:MAG: YkgJ family cysteine cluster protein [Deltaproteobacteria bacterium]|nr:YkgJ family cysteine cluster protein [Deltaproteobacteria bacterium]